MKTPDSRAMSMRSAARRDTGFSLLELLTVMAIIGLLAAMVAPNISTFKSDVVAGATRQLLDDVARARQLAIANHTTVYMVFVPTNFWNSPAYQTLIQDPQQRARVSKLFDKQLTSYAFVSIRSVGDQPGRPTARYLSPWKTLPDGVFFPPQKLVDPASLNTPITIDIYTNIPRVLAYRIPPFHYTSIVPFPSAQTPRAPGKNPYVRLPYIAFDYMGRLTPELLDYEYIPLVKGSVLYHRDPTNGLGMPLPALTLESPPGNMTNTYTLVRVDKLTGRPHAEHQEIR